MYFYHEGYHDAYYADASHEALTSRDRSGDDQTYEPITVPAIAAWLGIVGVALCVIATLIHVLG